MSTFIQVVEELSREHVTRFQLIRVVGAKHRILVRVQALRKFKFDGKDRVEWMEDEEFMADLKPRAFGGVQGTLADLIEQHSAYAKPLAPKIRAQLNQAADDILKMIAEGLW